MTRRRPSGPPARAMTTTPEPPITPGGRLDSWSSRPTRTMPTSVRRGPSRAGSTRARPAGWCAAPAATRAARTPTRIRSSWPPCARPSSAPRPRSSATPGVTFLHGPDGALANDLALREQLVREIRTFQPDAVFATDPDTIFYRGGGINHTDHRAAGIAAVDAVYPAARNPMAFPWLARVGPRTPSRPARLPVLVGAGGHLDRRVGHDRAKDRRPARPRQPDPRPRRAGRSDPIVGGGGGRQDRRGRRRGPSPGGHRRRRGRGSGLSVRHCLSSRSGRTRPHWFQISARPSARRPSIVTISPRVRSPAMPARYSSAATVTSLNRPAVARLVRPVPDPHRVEPGVAQRERHVALRGRSTIEPPAQAVEPEAERRQGLGDVAVLRPRERSPEGVAVGELEVARLDRVGHDRLDQPGQQELPASTRLGIVAGQAGHDGRHRRAIAVEHPEDPRGAAGLERQAERLVLVQPRHRRRLGPGGSRRRRRQRGSRCRGSFVALGDGLAGGQAGGIGVGGADPRRVGVEGQPLERGQDLGRRGVLARRDRRPRHARRC